MNEITKEEVIQRLKDIKYSVTIAKRAFEAVETFEMMANDIESDEEAIDIAIEALENQKTGHWTETDIYVYECSECGCKLVDEQIYIPRNFCPNCGAKMEGE